LRKNKEGNRFFNTLFTWSTLNRGWTIDQVLKNYLQIIAVFLFLKLGLPRLLSGAFLLSKLHKTIRVSAQYEKMFTEKSRRIAI